MIASGERLAFPDVGRPLVDKHSTGGVGDKITLPLAPLVAACGAAVPQLSGRGLGHTGGTLDKLESIPGWRAELSLDEIAAQLADVGAVICATTPTLAPADRKLYALRDVTGTVESIPLIASSIMSKKIAEGTDGLVLDVKSGSGAFMKTAERARELAATMVDIGAAQRAADHGGAHRHVRAAGPGRRQRAGGGRVGRGAARRRPRGRRGTHGRPGRGDAGAGRDRRRSGRGARLGRGVPGVGGDDRGAGRRPGGAAADRRARRRSCAADRSGVLERCDALAVGVAAWRLGAGRARKEHAVQAAAGIRLLVDVGDAVEAGQPLLELHTDTPDAVPGALAALEGGVVVGDGPAAARPPLIAHRPP